MQLRLVILRQNNRDAALRVFSVGLARFIFRQDSDGRARLCQRDRGPEAGNAAANDNEVGFKRHLLKNLQQLTAMY
jgi:hypothetical protein